MKVKIIKRKSIAEAIEVKRDMKLEELIAENDKLLKKMDDQFNNCLAEIKVINRILRDKLSRGDN